MLGFRGASRYAHPAYAEGFALECAAMKRVRDEMGLTNVRLMIPFCRRVDEAVLHQRGIACRRRSREHRLLVRGQARLHHSRGGSFDPPRDIEGLLQHFRELGHHY